MAAAAPLDAYFICATPRIGSELLLGLLDSTGVAGHPRAYFRAPDEQAWAEQWRLPRTPGGDFSYRDFVRAATAAGTTSNGVFGAKLMWGTHEQLAARLATVHADLAGDDLALLARAFGRLRFVHLWRDDPLAQAVSWARAEQTGVWQVTTTAPAPRPAPHTGSTPHPAYDHRQIDELVATVAAHNAGWRRWFATWGIEPFQVRYEELADDPVGVTDAIMDHLGLRSPAARHPTVRHRRQADQLNASWVARYRRQ